MRKIHSSDGTAIAFDQSGTGSPLIVVGGALSDRSAVTELAATLAPHFTVYAFDRRGRGDSGDTAPYAVEREIEDIAALIDDAGGSAFVFGHSSGAVLALTATSTFPSKVKKLALYEPPFFVNDGRPPLPNDYTAHLNALIAAGRRGDAVEYFLTTAVGVPAAVVAHMRSDPSWAKMEQVAHTLAYDGAIMGDSMSGKPLPAERWAAVTLPTLVMDGGQRANEEFLHHAALALVDVLPNAQYRGLDGQGHGAASEVLAPVLVEFFAG